MLFPVQAQAIDFTGVSKHIYFIIANINLRLLTGGVDRKNVLCFSCIKLVRMFASLMKLCRDATSLEDALKDTR